MAGIGDWLRRRPLVRGALTLTAVGVLNRAVGLVYRVLLARTAGAAALGLWQMTGPLERIASLTATLGLPISLSQVVASAAARGDHDRARAAARLALRLITVATVLTSLTIVVAAQPLGQRFLADPAAIGVFRLYPLVLVPSVFASWLRAYTQGYQSMLPTAWAQLIEQLTRVPAVLMLLPIFLPAGPGRAAQAIAIGTAAGEGAGLLLLLLLVRARRTGLPTAAQRPPGWWARLRPGHHRGLWRELLSLGTATLTVSIYGALFNVLYLNMIPDRLAAAGLPSSEFASLYGQLSGMVLPLLYMPMVFVQPLVRVLLPAAADAHQRQAWGRVQRLLRLCLLATGGLGIITWLVSTAWASPLISLLYGARQVGAARYLTLLSWAAPFAFSYHIVVSVLYGMGQNYSVVAILVIATLLRYGVTWHLVAHPAWGFDGVVVGILIDDIVSLLLTLLVLAHLWNRRRPRRDGRPRRSRPHPAA